jgi:hypothetical protein
MSLYLWLDDDRPAPPGWHWCKTVPEACRLLATRRVTYASLDHDLGQPENGSDLVIWMVHTGHWPRYRPGIHSANPLGAMRMQLDIIGSGRYR